MSADPKALEAYLLQLLNGERARSGLPAVTADGSLAAMARSHSQNMASEERIFHDPGKVGLLGRCAIVGENVGRATTADIVHQALMGSAIHRSDILGPYDRVGVGVAAGQTMIYATEVFCQSRSAPAPPAPQPAPVPAQPPKPSPVRKAPPPAPAAVHASPAPVPDPAPPAPAPLFSPGGMGSPCRLI